MAKVLGILCQTHRRFLKTKQGPTSGISDPPVSEKESSSLESVESVESVESFAGEL